MCSSMEVIDRAPYAEVTCLNEAMSHGRTLLFDVNVDYWRNRFGVREKKPYKILPGDVFVIADLKPETASDLQRVGRNWTFALLTNVRNDDDEYDNEEKSSFTSFRVKTLADNISKYEMRRKSLFVVPLMNVATNTRIWNALEMKKNPKP
ncbi:hypothetical protein V6N12_006074 [Hibiscus sabdariffa]|uniref:DUF6469 domain-containing protein n=1 Tax=Hibiscus sabdariffa TaxID=183260 RepID=A0ABR2EY35_9ROSI